MGTVGVCEVQSGPLLAQEIRRHVCVLHKLKWGTPEAGQAPSRHADPRLHHPLI